MYPSSCENKPDWKVSCDSTDMQDMGEVAPLWIEPPLIAQPPIDDGWPGMIGEKNKWEKRREKYIR